MASAVLALVVGQLVEGDKPNIKSTFSKIARPRLVTFFSETLIIPGVLIMRTVGNMAAIIIGTFTFELNVYCWFVSYLLFFLLLTVFFRLTMHSVHMSRV